MKVSSNTLQKRLAWFSAIAFFLTALSVGLRLCNLFFYYESDLGYYASDAVLPTVANLCMVVGLLALFGFAFFGFQSQEHALPVPTVSARILALAPAILSLLAALLAPQPELSVSLPMNTDLLLMSPKLFGLFLTLFFLLITFGLFRTSLGRGLSVLFGLLGMLYFIATLVITYFDFSVQMNAPIKLSLHLALISALLLLLAESRILVGVQRLRLSLFSFAAASVLLGSSSIPSLIAYRAEIFSAEYANLYPDLVCFALFLYAVCRLIAMGFGAKCAHPCLASTVRTDPSSEEQASVPSQAPAEAAAQASVLDEAETSEATAQADASIASTDQAEEAAEATPEQPEQPIKPETTT